MDVSLVFVGKGGEFLLSCLLAQAKGWRCASTNARRKHVVSVLEKRFR